MSRNKFRLYSKAAKKYIDYNVIGFSNSGELRHYSTENGMGPVFDDDYIIEQSTGLFDRNGKEIFVGDILKCPLGEEFGNMVVVYNIEFGMYEFQDKNGETPTCADFEHYGSGDEQEVIGNINNDGELLK